MAAAPRTRRRSITKTHERIAHLGWEPDYHQPAVRYPTRYQFPKNAKDPMKQSAEGDAIASVMRAREGVEVIEQRRSGTSARATAS
jgi:hypothetical protein